MEAKLPKHFISIKETLDTEVVDWGISAVKAPESWEITRGEGVKIAVLDTGIDRNHPDLVPNLKGGINFTTNDRNDWQDRQGHGTHVAGCIAGCDNSIGVVGIAPQAELYAVKVLGDNGSGSLGWIVDGVQWAIDNKMDVISMSLGCESAPPEIFREVYKRAELAGIPVIVAAGNENQHVGWPAAYPETISVGAIDRYMSKAVFSNFGKEIDIVAPGVDIYSTYLHGQYVKMSGTSMATPIISGCVALLLAQCKKEGKTISLSEIKDRLIKATNDLGVTGKDFQYGNGLIDLSLLLG